MSVTKSRIRRIVRETRRRLDDNPYAFVGDDVGPREIPAQYQSKLFSALGMLGFETGLDPENEDFRYDILDGLIQAERQLRKDGFENPSAIIDFIKPKVADIFRKEPGGAGIPRTEALVAAIPFDVFNNAAGGPFASDPAPQYVAASMWNEEEDEPPMIDEAKTKMSRKQIQRIIKEEKSKLIKEQRDVGAGIFNKDYIYDLFEPEFTDLLQYRRGRKRMSDEELEMFRQAVNDAVRDLIRHYRE